MGKYYQKCNMCERGIRVKTAKDKSFTTAICSTCKGTGRLLTEEGADLLNFIELNKDTIRELLCIDEIVEEDGENG